MNFIVLLVIFVALVVVVDAQNPNLRGRKKNARQRMKDGGKMEEGQIVQALDIAYPLKFFAAENTDTWRSEARYSAELDEISNDGEYKKHTLAQDQEDIWLYENWFYGMKAGVIMESGALNGLTFSTSYMFETFADWTALHVEADPENYKNLRGNREQAVNVHAALCSETKLLHYSSFGVIPVRGFVEFMTESFIKKWHGPIYNGKVKIEDLPTTQCVPVKLLMRELNVHHIDIWILDTEGAEESVLKGTDFSEVHINAVAMECDEHDLAKNARKTDILEANGFQCALVERNCMCKHKDYKPRRAPKLSELQMFDGKAWKKTYGGDNLVPVKIGRNP